MNDVPRDLRPSPSSPPSKPTPDPASPPAESPPAKQLTPEEQMALFEQELKETDWGHQPC